jgi:sugar phosphate isomerase/epimerase
MLLTLTANALRARIVAPGRKPAARSRASEAASPEGSLQITDLPRFAREDLGLFGLNLSTNLLIGADLKRIDSIRDAADKSSCPVLTLVESETQAMGTTDDALGDAAIARAHRVVQAAHRLGCSSVGLSVACKDNEDEIDFCIERLRRVLQVAERLEVNVLICPAAGITAEPERLTDLIKKVGGFRIGTFPDFETASKAADPLTYLKRVTPYASAVTAAAIRFKPGKKPGEFVHDPYDLRAFANVVKAVGYTGTLALDARGDQDPVDTIRKAKALLESVIGTGPAEAPEADDELVAPVDSEPEGEASDDDGEEE